VDQKVEEGIFFKGPEKWGIKLRKRTGKWGGKHC